MIRKGFKVLGLVATIASVSVSIAATEKKAPGREALDEAARVKSAASGHDLALKANKVAADVDSILGARNVTPELRQNLITSMSHPVLGSEITKQVEFALADIQANSAAAKTDNKSAKALVSIRKSQIEGFARIKLESTEGTDAAAAEILFTKVPGKASQWDVETQENVRFLMLKTKEYMKSGLEQGKALNEALKDLARPQPEGRGVKIEKASDIAKLCL